MTYTNNVTDTLFADVSEFQTPVTQDYINAGYRVLSIRSNDGTYLDGNFANNYQFCVNAVNSGAFDFFFVYYYWRTGGTGVNTHMAQVNGQGGPHPQMVSMIDLESGGNPIQDWSSTLNGEVVTLGNWLGNQQRVIGYANSGDLLGSLTTTGMWLTRPPGLRLIGAGYGANPNLPGQIAHQYTDGNGYGGGLPEGAPPWATCDMNSADGLSSQEFASALGVGAPVAPPPVVIPPPVTSPPSTGSVPPVSTPTPPVAAVPPPANPSVDQALTYLIQELSASGDTALTASTDTVPAPNLTLRSAVQAILWITNAAVDMKGTDSATNGRPFPPTTADTILGHILNMRAEGLITQAIVADLASALGRDVKTIIANAKASWS